MAVNSEEMAIHHPYAVGEALIPTLAYLLKFGVVFAFAILGIALSFRKRPAAELLALCSAGVFLSLLIFYVADRYRISAIPMLIPLAALGVTELVGLVRQGSVRRMGLGFVGLFLVFGLTQIPLVSEQAHRRAIAGSLNIMGKAEGDRGDLVKAQDYFLRALELTGEGRGSVIKGNLGLVAEKRGRLSEAEEWYRKAAEADPENRFARYKLVRLCKGRDDLKQALVWLRQLEAIEADGTRVRQAMEDLQRRLSEKEKRIEAQPSRNP